MEYTNLIEPFGVITISLLVGGFFGAYWMFLMMYRTEKNLLKELDAKNKELKEWKDTWERTQRRGHINETEDEWLEKVSKYKQN